MSTSENLERFADAYREFLKAKKRGDIRNPTEPTPGRFGITGEAELYLLNRLKVRLAEEVGCQ